MFFLFFRRWKEVGEQPSLWAKLKLHFEDETHYEIWDPEEEEEKEEVPDKKKPLLHQVLTLPHLDCALQHLLTFHLASPGAHAETAAVP